jgi:hypothetical protein
MAFLEEPSPVQQFKITAKELDVRGSRPQNNKFEEVINVYKEGKIRVEGQVSHIFPFVEAVEAFRRIRIFAKWRFPLNEKWKRSETGPDGGRGVAEKRFCVDLWSKNLWSAGGTNGGRIHLPPAVW